MIIKKYIIPSYVPLSIFVLFCLNIQAKKLNHIKQKQKKSQEKISELEKRVSYLNDKDDKMFIHLVKHNMWLEQELNRSVKVEKRFSFAAYLSAGTMFILILAYAASIKQYGKPL